MLNPAHLSHLLSRMPIQHSLLLLVLKHPDYLLDPYVKHPEYLLDPYVKVELALPWKKVQR
jgi:hypothetical protein